VLANWLINDVLNALSQSGTPISECPVRAPQLRSLIALVENGTINARQAKEVFAEMFASGRDPQSIVEERGLKQESDSGAIETLASQVIEANPKAVAEYRAGKTASINFLKGQVMKLSQGKANPSVVNEILERLLA
jgi:aspartyl-tRNA(Asn)/glutamyl-tRNA(Gln) amidotransferase subunit B